jgi:hypothetical protein
MTVPALLSALRRRWRLAVSLGLLCGALAATGAWFVPVPRKFTARTLLHVPPPRHWLVKTGEPLPDALSHQRTQVALAKSRLVLMTALADPSVARFGLKKDQAEIEALDEQLKVDFSVAPEILCIEMSGEDPDRILALVSLVQRVYLDEFIDIRKKQQRERLEKLKALREANEARLKEGQAEQKKLEGKAGHRAADVRAMQLGFLQMQLGWNEKDLLQTRTELRKATNELGVLREKEKKLPQLSEADAEDVEQLLLKDARMQKLVAEEHYAGDLLDTTLALAARGDEDPRVIELRSQLKRTREALEARRKFLRPAAEAKVRAKALGELRVGVANLEARIAGLQ